MLFSERAVWVASGSCLVKSFSFLAVSCDLLPQFRHYTVHFYYYLLLSINESREDIYRLYLAMIRTIKKTLKQKP